MARISHIKNQLNDGIEFLSSVPELYNCHMVNFIADNIWEKNIPIKIREELDNINEEDMIEFLYSCGKSRSMPDLMKAQNESALTCPSLFGFLVRCRKFVFEMMNPIVNGEYFSEVISRDDSKESNLFISKEQRNRCNVSSQYLTPSKKRHEVTIMSSFITKLCKIHMDDRGISGALVDIGGGKGYLGSALVFHKGLRVLGIDAASEVTSAARNRYEKICHKLSEKCSLYQHRTAFVTSNTDLGSLVQQLESEWGAVNSLALVGLHTCGDLSPSVIRLFTSKQVCSVPITVICNVGCCYNLLKEKYIPEGSFDKAHHILPPLLNGHTVDIPKDVSPGFPLSNFLCSKKLWLGRNARNLASQSLERVMNQKKIAVETLFQRAVLQSILLDYSKSSSFRQKYLTKLDEMFIEGKGVGRINKRNATVSMSEYLKKAFKKLELSFEMSDDAVLELCQKLEHLKSKITIFYLLRLFLAPVIEMIILLDRLLFLLEEGINEAYIIKLFDPVVSPRCYALFALKQ